LRTNCLYLVVPLPLAPPLPDMPPPLPDVDGLDGDVDGLDGEVDGLGDGEVDGLLPLPVAPEPAPLRCSCRHFSRSMPVRAAHLAGTSVEAPVAELPLVPLAPVLLEPDVWASVAPDRARSAAAVAAVSAFRIMCASPREGWLETAVQVHANAVPAPLQADIEEWFLRHYA
jgi:hypothetical protein